MANLLPLRFHKRHGAKATLSNGERTAERLNPTEDYSDGIVFTNRPLQIDEPFEIKLETLLAKWEGSLQIGVTTQDPNTMEFRNKYMTDLIPQTGSIFIKKVGKGVHIDWSTNPVKSGKHDLEKLEKGDRIRLIRTRDCELKFYVNDQLDVTVANCPPSVWGVVNLYGNAVKVTCIQNKVHSRPRNSPRTQRKTSSIRYQHQQKENLELPRKDAERSWRKKPAQEIQLRQPLVPLSCPEDTDQQLNQAKKRKAEKADSKEQRHDGECRPLKTPATPGLEPPLSTPAALTSYAQVLKRGPPNQTGTQQHLGGAAAQPSTAEGWTMNQPGTQRRGGENSDQPRDVTEEQRTERGSVLATESLPMHAFLPGYSDAHVLSLTWRTAYDAARRDSQTGVFRMESRPRGEALILNNERFENFDWREGTSRDCADLETLFRDKLGFRVTTRHNLTADRMRIELERFAADPRLENVDACMVAILTHGAQNEVLYGTDGNEERTEETSITLSQAMKLFTSSNCRAMNDKPKLFILQACKGNQEDRIYSPRRVHGRDVIPENFDEIRQPDYADMFAMFATVEGYVAFRNHFIPILKEVFWTLAGRLHIKDLATEVNRRVSRKAIDSPRQRTISSDYSTLTKQFYFNPPPSGQA